jgi:outer membrane protein TolC
MIFFGLGRAVRRVTLLVVVLSAVPLAVLADDGQGLLRLSANEAVELGLRNNLGLEAARVNTASARRSSNLAWNQFVPSVDVGGGLFRLNAPIAGIPQWGLTASLSVTLDFNFAMFEEMRRVRLDFESGLLSYRTARAQLERDIRKAYHNMLLLKENIALLHESFESAERQAQIIQSNFTVGLASELNLLQAQVARENLRPIIDQAEAGLQLSMMQFSMFLGLPYNTNFELIPVTDGIFPIHLDTAELITRAAASQPDVQALRQEILVMNSIRQSARLRLLTPSLFLGWNADPMFGGDPWADDVFDRDRWRQQEGALSFTVGFRLNGLLPFLGDRQAVRSLEDQIRMANIGLAQMIQGTEIEIHNLVLTLKRIQVSMEALRQTVVLAERSFYLAEQAHRAGMIDLLQVQNAELSLRQARVQLNEQQFNYLNGLLDLEYALGLPFGTLALTESQN